MARKKDQEARRRQLVEATVELLAERGIEGLTLAAIADRAGVSHRLVAYYYADLESLVLEAHEAAAERYYWSRLRHLDAASGAEERLLQLIRSGLPSRRDRLLSQVLNELSLNASRSRVHARLTGRLFDQEVSLYLGVLEQGLADGTFRLQGSAESVARNLVALEDAYGLHLLALSSPVSRRTALEGLVGYARAATGAVLATPTRRSPRRTPGTARRTPPPAGSGDSRRGGRPRSPGPAGRR